MLKTSVKMCFLIWKMQIRIIYSKETQPNLTQPNARLAQTPLIPTLTPSLIPVGKGREI